MKKKWLEIKKALENYHPYTKVNYLKGLLPQMIEKEIEKSIEEIEVQRLWKKHGLPFTRRDEIEEETRQEQESLEEVVEEQRPEELKGITYENVRDIYEDLGRLRERSYEGTLSARERERLNEIGEELSEYRNVVNYGEVSEETRETFNRSENILKKIEK